MCAEFPLTPDGSDSFVLGMDGYTSPNLLQNGEYVEGMNIICRGGPAQTRPGSISSPMKLPRGRVQGMTMFKPNSGIQHLVFAINGLVYASPYPFQEYSQLRNIKFSPYSKFVAWATGIKSSEYAPNGDLVFVDSPTNILIMQDGVTQAAFWDGSQNRHLNPVNLETPVGLWMQWSNNRLWVSRGSQIFASDIGNPLGFSEGQYLNEGRAFYLTGPCTGIAESSDRQGIICFTSENGSFIQSSIQDRTQWLNTAGFQQLLLPNIGCVSARSIVQQYGENFIFLNWEYS